MCPWRRPVLRTIFGVTFSFGGDLIKMLRLLRTTEGRILLLTLALASLALGVSVRNAVDRQRPVVAAEISSPDRAALARMQDAFASIADQVEPTVVSIRSVHVDQTSSQRPRVTPQLPDDEDLFGPFRDFFRRFQGPDMPPPAERSSGSGFIFRAYGNDAYILTNQHVVEDATRVRVSFGNDENSDMPATVVGTDDKTDLAVLKVHFDRPVPPERVARLGDSSTVRVGQWAIAIGNPLGVGETLTVGVISAKNRELSGVQGIRSYRDMIQTDAAINMGNSGGPLVDLDGRVIGINTAIASPTGGSVGIGFAIPINTAKSVIDSLVRTGTVTRGWLGVETVSSNRELSPELQQYYGVSYGALVDRVRPDGPAAKAGIKAEDVIVSWDGKPIHNFSELEDAVTSTPPGRSVEVGIVRNKRHMTVTVVTEKRPSESALQNMLRGQDNEGAPNEGVSPQAMSRPDALGITARSMTDADRQQAGAPSQGVVVTMVMPGSRADDAGLQRGDIITKVNGQVISSLSDYRSAVRAAGGKAVVMRVFSRLPDESTLDRTVVVRP